MSMNNGSNFRGKVYRNSGNLASTQFVSNQLTGYQLYAFVFDRTNLHFSSFRNGTVKDYQISDPTPIPADKILRIFAGNSNDKNPAGKMAEVICIKSATESDRQKVEGYLAHKWGIASSLANTHPFSSGTPSYNLPLAETDLGNQTAGTFSHQISGLSSGTTYYYRFLAQNSGGASISSVSSFETVGPADLLTIFPSNVTPSSATLRSILLSNGQEDPTITFYWGDENGSSNPSNWDSSQTLSGTHGVGQVGHSISGLSQGVTYYFTAKAVNSGENLGPRSLVFRQ